MGHLPPLPERVDIDAVVANSYKDFHTKGFDYVCLRRSLTETIKLYFFDGDTWKLPEVVAPHDHRYDFSTYVACGASENVWFERSDLGLIYNKFEYRTPLNGGSGFSFAGEERLSEVQRRRFAPGRRSYFMAAQDLHTIRIVANETVLVLFQFEDVLPIDKPTSTFTLASAAPGLDGLYSRFKPDEVIARLKRFEEKTGYRFQLGEG